MAEQEKQSTNESTLLEKRENPLLSLVCNIAVPTYILTKLANEDYLGNIPGFYLALAFPVGYSIYDYIVRRKFSLIAALGFISVLLNGVIKIFSLDGIWFAIKEASIPAAIGLAVLYTQRTKRPLIKEIFYNKQILNTEKIESALTETHHEQEFQRLLQKATYIIFGSFVFSAIMNFILAYYIVQSPAETDAFNEELGKMTAYSWIVIAVPSTIMLLFAMWQFGSGLRKLTNLEWNDILRQQS